jgi:hypothetical protein
MNENLAIATGRIYIDRDPLMYLKTLQAKISWSGTHGYIIQLSDEERKRLHEVVAFNSGEEM